MLLYSGDQGSQLILQDVIRVKPACQLPTSTLQSAASFQRVSPAYPPNNLTLWPNFCFDAAVNGSSVTHNCYQNALHFNAFSNIAASDDPNLGRQVGLAGASVLLLDKQASVLQPYEFAAVATGDWCGT